MRVAGRKGCGLPDLPRCVSRKEVRRGRPHLGSDCRRAAGRGQADGPDAFGPLGADGRSVGGALGPAELLGLPQATIAIEVDASGEQLRVKRELESGWYQWYSMPKPALLTIQSGISQIRYATLKGIMAAKKKEIKEITPSADIVGRPSHQRVEKVYLPQKSKQTQLLGDGDAKAGAVALAEKLHSEARVF